MQGRARVDKNVKYVTVGLLGIGAVAVGSLLFALVIDSSGDSTGQVFLGALGLGFHISGVGVIIAAVWAYLRNSD